MSSRLHPRQGSEKEPPIELTWQIYLPWLALASILLMATRTDPDLWGHVRFGLDWLRTRALPSIDPYSFTQDRPWVNHEWLSEASMGAAFALAGPAGLVVLKTVVVSGAAFVVWRRLAGSSPLVRAGVTTVAIVSALPLTGTVRPQIWSLLGLALLVPVLENRPPSPRRIVSSTALFGVWANLHGGWITGGAALATHIAIRAVRAPREAGKWLALGAASLAATLINPYGAGLWRFLATTVRSSRPDVTEWAPFSLHEPLIMWVSVVSTVAALALLLRKHETRPPLEACAVVILLVVAGLRVSRVAPLVCPACLALLGPWIAKASGTIGVMRVPNRVAAGVLLFPGVLATFAAREPVSSVLSCVTIRDVWAPDRLAAASLLSSTGRLWVAFDWGEYAIWHFGPALRVSIDGRRETVYSARVIDWHRAVERGDPTALAQLIEVAPEYVWMPAARDAVRDTLVKHGYRLDVQTPDSFVAVRSDLAQLPAGRPALPQCFP
jgi:hypothetical protein